MDLLRKAWEGDIAEFRVISQRNGASIIYGEREYFTVVDPKKRT